MDHAMVILRRPNVINLFNKEPPKAMPEDLQEQLDRYRRRHIHLVLPATNEAMKRLDSEIYHKDQDQDCAE
jgi:hypothetical protein